MNDEDFLRALIERERWRWEWFTALGEAMRERERKMRRLENAFILCVAIMFLAPVVGKLLVLVLP